MPKREPVFRTDKRTTSGVIAGGGGGGSSAVTAHALDDTAIHTGTLTWAQLNKTGSSLADLATRPHSALSGIGANDHHDEATAGDGIALTGQQIAVDGTVVRTTRTLTAGSGLTGGGTLAADRTFNVGAGTMITVGADTVGVTAGANYQFIGTGGGTAAGWRNVSELAGNGLAHSAGVLAVGAGNGITVNANDVALTTPGTLTVSSTNSASGNHTHAVTSSSNPGAATSLLKSDTSGALQLVTLASNNTFVSGFTGVGYRVDYGITEASKASAEFDNLTVRGRMRVYELLIQQIRATNGSVFVSSASRAETVTDDSAWEVNATTLEFNGGAAEFATDLWRISTRDESVDDVGTDEDHDLYHGFLTNDLIRAQRFAMDSNGAFASVRRADLQVGTVHSLYEYTAAFVSGDAPVAGDDFVRLGNTTDTTRQGSVYLTADDSNAPYIDIVDGISSHATFNGIAPKVRLGKLNGITDADFGGNLSGPEGAPNYGLYADNVYLKGEMIITGGSGYATLTDRPTALSDINSTEGSKLSGIAAGATVGATWGTNLSNIPATLGTPSGAGLYLSATHLGYYNGSAWRTYMDNSGNFYLTGSGSNSLSWNGATLAINGQITATVGTIGGWTLGASALTGGNASLSSTGVLSLGTGNDIAVVSAADATYRLWAGHATAASAPFRVTKAGALTATGATLTSATVSGAITASSGAISGWSITTNALSDSGIALYSSVGGATPRLEVGAGANSNYAGIAGYSDGGSSNIMLWAGQTYANRASAPFRITAGGALTATNATITGATVTGSITASSGSITGQLSFGTAGSLYSGKTTYAAHTTTGWWLGTDSGTPKFSIGSEFSYMRWDGSDILITSPKISSGWTAATYGTSWSSYTDFGTYALQYTRLGELVMVTGWVQGADTFASGNYTIATGLPTPNGGVTALLPVRTNVAANLGGGCDVVKVESDGDLVAIVNTSGGDSFNLNLLINVIYRAS